MGIGTNRREFLIGASALAGAAAATRAGAAAMPSTKAMRGIFPIAWTACTPDNKLDTSAMVEQAKFCNRGKVAGLVWPQNASAWSTLSQQEWNDGADALLSVKGKTTIVLGVQTVGFDTDKSVHYAKAAARKGADAIISLAPPNASDDQILAYYKAIGSATKLPLMAQAVGNISVDLLVELSKQVPTFFAVKDEAGDPLARAPGLLARTGGKLEDFSGAGGHKLFAEMQLGMLGSCPYVGLADVLQQSFDLFQAGDRKASYDVFGQFLAFDSIPGANDYVLVARGVFKEDAVMRKLPGSRPDTPPLTNDQKQAIREALTILKPYLIA
jgi:dihydrodipicolinate synthase/N-acetylneuraminate lyase